MYAEIDDDFIDSEFDATSCNDYCSLPASPSRRGSVPAKKISCDQTSAGGSVFVFDATAANLNVPKTGTRSRKLDSEGYEKPITTAEKRRNVTYLNTAYEISNR